jgi:hypothetical protein
LRLVRVVPAGAGFGPAPGRRSVTRRRPPDGA